MTATVLLIEDELNIVEAISFILIRDGWRVSSHSNGATAMEAIERVKPSVVILDVMLPNLSGFEVLRQIRAAPSTKDLPVLMLTARGQSKDRAEALEAGASRFMSKPFSNGDILAAVKELSDG